MQSLLASSSRVTLRAPRATTRMEAETSAAPKAPAAAKKERKPGPMDGSGTKSGAAAAGSNAGAKAKAKAMGVTYVAPRGATTFEDPRWVEGCWDFAQFAGADGETDWNGVVDAEVRRNLPTLHAPRMRWMPFYPARGSRARCNLPPSAHTTSCSPSLTKTVQEAPTGCGSPGGPHGGSLAAPRVRHRETRSDHPLYWTCSARSWPWFGGGSTPRTSQESPLA